MTDINNDQDELIRSSHCQTPLASQLNDGSSVSKKTRGPTKCLDIHGLSHEDRLPISLNVHGQPVGCNRGKLSSYLGTLARNAHFAPLTYTSWHGLKEKREDMWKTVVSKFDIEERGKKWVLKTLGSCWKTHKSRLKKKYFNVNMTEDYNLNNRPSIVPLEQWKLLIKFWNSDVVKDRSTKNKISRAKNSIMHTTGSKTFAEIREEETTKNPSGREPSRVEMFLITHTPKNGKPMSEGTSRIMSELEEVMALHPEASEQSTTPADIFTQVFGKDRPGHVRTYGQGVVPSDLWDARSQLGTQKLIEEVKENAQAEMQIMQHKMQEEMEAKLQKQVEAIKTDMLNSFNMVLNQLQKSFPGVVIPDLSTMSMPNINEGKATNARSSAATHHVVAEAKECDQPKKRGKRGKRKKRVLL